MTRKRSRLSAEEQNIGSSSQEGPAVKRPKRTVHLEGSGTQRAKRCSKLAASKTSNPRSRQAPRCSNVPPQYTLNVFVFGRGDAGELGLGRYVRRMLEPTLNPFLDANRPNTFHAVQLACGQTHTVVLTVDNRIVTWGINENGALGRSTYWADELREEADGSADSDSSSEGETNPFESTPTAIESTEFPPDTIFTQVSAGAHCTFALTSTGSVFGWGTFVVSRVPEASLTQRPTLNIHIGP